MGYEKQRRMDYENQKKLEEMESEKKGNKKRKGKDTSVKNRR